MIRVWTFITANEGFLTRLIDYLSFMFSSFVASLFVRRVDIVVGTSPQFFTVCAAYFTSIVKRVPWVFELRDIWPESIRAVGAIENRVALDILEKIELHLYHKASAIISVTNSFRSNLMERGIDGRKIHTITNGVDLSHFYSRNKDAYLLEELGLGGKFIVGYIGTHGLAHALETILDAAKTLKSAPDGERFRFLFLGEGASRAALLRRAQEEKLDNVIFIDSKPRNEVVRYWSILDVAIIHLKKDLLFRTVIPSKLFECMSMGVPILHGVEGESASIVRQADVGVLFEPENPASMIYGLRTLSDEPELLARYRQNGPVAAEQFERNVLAAAMLKILEDRLT